MAFDPLTAITDLLGKGLDKIFPDKNAADAAKLRLIELQQNGELAKLAAETDLLKKQIVVNIEEAKSGSLFVSVWRPFVGWVCGLGLAFQFLFRPIATWIAALCGSTQVVPSLDMGTLMVLLSGMLGFSGMRTFERFKGVANQ